MTLRTLNYGNYGIFLIMGNAGFCPSAVTPFTLAKPPGTPQPQVDQHIFGSFSSAGHAHGSDAQHSDWLGSEFGCSVLGLRFGWRVGGLLTVSC